MLVEHASLAVPGYIDKEKLVKKLMQHQKKIESDNERSTKCTMKQSENSMFGNISVHKPVSSRSVAFDCLRQASADPWDSVVKQKRA